MLFNIHFYVIYMLYILNFRPDLREKHSLFGKLSSTAAFTDIFQTNKNIFMLSILTSKLFQDYSGLERHFENGSG